MHLCKHGINNRCCLFCIARVREDKNDRAEGVPSPSFANRRSVHGGRVRFIIHTTPMCACEDRPRGGERESGVSSLLILLTFLGFISGGV